MIAFAQQRQHDRADRRHAGAEADGGDAVLHPVDFFLQRGGGRIALAAVDVALRLALEDRGQLARVAVAVRDREVQRLVQRAVLDRRFAVGVQNRGGESGFA